MATRVIDDTKLQNIAVAIQCKDSGGTMTVDEMPTRIALIPTQDMTLIDSLVNRRITAFSSEVSSVEEYAFYGCSLLTSIVLPCAAALKNSCIRNCTRLNEIEIPKVESILNNCFYGDRALVRLFLQSVTSLTGGAIFTGCQALNTVIMGKRAALGDVGAFTSNNATIYVQPDDLSWYSTATNWSTLYANNRIKSVSELTGDNLTWYQQQLAKYPEEE